jgi:hypothetical protein
MDRPAGEAWLAEGEPRRIKPIAHQIFLGQLVGLGRIQSDWVRTGLIAGLIFMGLDRVRV